MLATFSPPVTVLSVHPGSLVLVLFYIGGLALIRGQQRPMWRAVAISETRPDVPSPQGPLADRRASRLWLEFGAIAAVVVLGGWAVA